MEVAEDTKSGSVVEGEGYPILNPAKDCIRGTDLLLQPWCKGAPCAWPGIAVQSLHHPGEQWRIGGRGH